MKLNTLYAAGTAAVISLSASTASAVPVDLELVFLNDVSGSINTADFNAQISGYAAAFRDSALISQIENGVIGSIAVSIGFFASSTVQSIDWAIISDTASGEAFATALELLTRPSAGAQDYTSLAIDTAVGYFSGNGIEGTRQVIDVVTEGAQSTGGCGSFTMSCVALQNSRDAALAAGVDQINAMLLQDRGFFGDNPGDSIDAVQYAETNIIGGIGSFATFTEDFTEFSPAIRDKISREVTPSAVPLPLPATMLLTGLFGLGMFRKRKS